MERISEKSGFQRLFSSAKFKAKNQYIQAVFDKISRCHTPSLGYHCYRCNNPACQDIHTQYHSCGNRHCPFCGTMKKDQWVEDRIADLLPTPYYHIVFTIPHEWNKVMMQSPREFYNIFFEAASRTLLGLGANPEYLGATPGITAVLHTWGQQLNYHVHLHCIVTGGGVNASNGWVAAKRTNGKFLFPEAALKRVYKGTFLSLIRKRKQHINGDKRQIDEAIRLSGYKSWKVYAKAPFGGPDQVIKYLGRYTHKTAITHHRILKVDDERIHFEYKDYADGNKVKEKNLNHQEFMRRFERHILPLRFVRIRHYRILTNRGKLTRINAIRKQMGLEAITTQVEIPIAIRLMEKFGTDITRCQQCKTGHYELLFTKRYDKITYCSSDASP